MSILDTIHYYIEETRDPRTQSWPLISIPALVIPQFSYLYFIYVCGPRYMKDKPPYNLKTIIRFYNIFQIFANTTLVYTSLNSGWFNDVINICGSSSYSTDSLKMQMISVIWWMYMLKVFDYIETVFFVLRKKNRQVSYLHVHHHAMTVFLSWLAVRYVPEGMASFVLVINCSVHVIMYMYYFLSSLSPTMQKMINPYKSILTSIQIIQLIVISLYITITILPGCNYPKVISFIALPNILLNLYFFQGFYKKSYKRPVKQN